MCGAWRKMPARYPLLQATGVQLQPKSSAKRLGWILDMVCRAGRAELAKVVLWRWRSLRAASRPGPGWTDGERSAEGRVHREDDSTVNCELKLAVAERASGARRGKRRRIRAGAVLPGGGRGGGAARGG